MMLDLYSMSADLNPKMILRIEEVLHRTGLKRTMLYDLIGKEKFPKQFSLGARAVGWYEDEVEVWIRDREATKCEHEGCVRMDGITMQELKTPTNKLGRVPQSTTSAPPPFGRRSDAARATPAPTNKNPAAAHAAMTLSEELKLLRDENARLKRLIADLMLKNDQLLSSMQERAAAF